MQKACAPSNVDFSTERIKRCKSYVYKKQRELDKAVANDNVRRIQEVFNLLLQKSEAAKILAVHHVTTNKGAVTAGMDGERMLDKSKVDLIEVKKEIEQKNLMHKTRLVETIDVRKKPEPIKRVYIPKRSGGKRPLGILTLKDRIIQDLYRMALEPLVEYHFNDSSYGFRPKRSCQDAIMHLYLKLNLKQRPKWIIDADIKGCFDNISHEYVLNILKEWRVPRYIREQIERMMKVEIVEQGVLEEVWKGTPQGGVISPMLANVALTKLDNWGSTVGSYDSNQIVRYADDFVTVVRTEEEAKELKEQINDVLKEIGLWLSEEKTKIVEIHDGFNFLGFNIRKYRDKSSNSKYREVGKLLIRPEKERVFEFIDRLRDFIDDNKQVKVPVMIKKLNEKLRGFGMYYRFQVSKATFSYVDEQIYQKLWIWSKRRHPNKSGSWVQRKYFGKSSVLYDKETEMKLMKLKKIPIMRYKKVKAGMRVYTGDEETRDYWKKREYENGLNQIYSIAVKKLYQKQKGKCVCCNKGITAQQIESQSVHRHHMLPKSESGTDKLNNLRLLHKECHKRLHSLFTRKQMAQMSQKGLNYLSKETTTEAKNNPKEFFDRLSRLIESESGVS